jgi:hypothetical protein
MADFKLVDVLKLLPAVGPVVAALPEFRKIYDGIVQTFDSATDQQTLMDAYDTAISGAADAHQDLQDLVRQHS